MSFMRSAGHASDVPVVDALVGDGRVNDCALARLLNLDCHCAALVLVGNKRCNVGLDTTGTETNDDDGCNVSAESVSACDGRGKSACPKDQKTDPVDTSEDQDSVVLSEVLIGNDGTENGSDVAEELEEDVQASSSGVSETKTSRSIASVRVVADVVLEETLAACCKSV